MNHRSHHAASIAVVGWGVGGKLTNPKPRVVAVPLGGIVRQLARDRPPGPRTTVWIFSSTAVGHGCRRAV